MHNLPVQIPEVFNHLDITEKVMKCLGAIASLQQNH